MGVLPEALVNYLALLGWAPSGGTREIFSKDELIKEFSLERVTPSPAVFDMEKLYWLNRHYIKESSAERIAALIAPFNRKGVEITDDTTFSGDLEFDSLTVMDFVAAIEDEFDIIISMNQQAEIETYGQLVDAVCKLQAD